MGRAQDVGLPPGFELEEDQADQFGLPPGFSLEPISMGSSSIGDLRREEARQMPQVQYPRWEPPAGGVLRYPGGQGPPQFVEAQGPAQLLPPSVANRALTRLLVQGRAPETTVPLPPSARYGRFAPPTVDTTPALPEAIMQAGGETVQQVMEHGVRPVVEGLTPPEVRQYFEARHPGGWYPGKPGEEVLPVSRMVEGLQQAREQIAPGMAERALGIRQFPELGPNVVGVGDALTRAGAHAAGGLLTPEMLLAGGATAKAPQILQALASGGFSLDMFNQAYQAVPEFRAAVDQKNWPAVAEIGANIVSSGGLGAMALGHSAQAGPEAVVGAVRDAADSMHRAADRLTDAMSFAGLGQAAGQGFAEGARAPQPTAVQAELARRRGVPGRAVSPQFQPGATPEEQMGLQERAAAAQAAQAAREAGAGAQGPQALEGILRGGPPPPEGLAGRRFLLEPREPTPEEMRARGAEALQGILGTGDKVQIGGEEFTITDPGEAPPAVESQGGRPVPPRESAAPADIEGAGGQGVPGGAPEAPPRPETPGGEAVRPPPEAPPPAPRVERPAKFARAYVSPRQRSLTPEETETRRIAYALKDSDPKAIATAAEEMAPFVSREGVGPRETLVPIPDHNGSTAANFALAREIARRTGAGLADVLRREGKAESSTERRRAGQPGLPAEAHRFVLRGAPPLNPVFVDNVTTTGATFAAARKALRGNGRGIAFAKAEEVTGAAPTEPAPTTGPLSPIGKANKYLNLTKQKNVREAGFAYLGWLKGGGVGIEPTIPGKNGELVKQRILQLLGPDPFRAAGAVGAELPKPPEVAPAPQAAPKPPVEPPRELAPNEVARGPQSEVLTERGERHPVEWAVVDRSRLVASHNAEGEPNPQYPTELQPRDRSRVASKQQIDGMARQLRPELLVESPKAADGAPIIGPDGVVESGNGRVAAIGRAYELGTGDEYRRAVLQKAEQLGIDLSKNGVPREPVLVRIRRGGDRAEFARQANEASVAKLSPTEQAISDAKRLSRKTLNLIADEDLLAASNRPFVRQFMQEVPGPTEAGGMLTGEGGLNVEGLRRIQNAVLAKAYGDSAALETILESPDANVKNIGSGLMRAAPQMAKMLEGIEAGTMYDYGISKELAAAVNKIAALRRENQSIGDYLKQEQMFGGGQRELSPEVEAIMAAFDENSRSAKRIAKFLESYVNLAEAGGDPRQGGIFGAGPAKEVNRLETIDLAREEARRDDAAAGNLFSTEAPARPVVPGEDAGETPRVLPEESRQVRPDTGARAGGAGGRGGVRPGAPAAPDRRGFRVADPELTGDHHGQQDFTVRAFAPSTGRQIGFLDYTLYGDELHVRMVEVDRRYRRRGVASQLYDKMRAEHPEATLQDAGYRTGRGGLFRQAYDARRGPDYQLLSTEEPRRVYHGSAARFDRFDDEFIGTGEGSQAFSWGHYFAERKALAKSYEERQAKLKGGAEKFSVDGVEMPARGSSNASMFLHDDMALYFGTMRNLYDPNINPGGTNLPKQHQQNQRFVAGLRDDVNRRIAEWLDRNSDRITEGGAPGKPAAPDVQPVLDLIRWWDEHGRDAKLEQITARRGGVKGSLYTTLIPGEPEATYLDWDAPLSEQPEATKAALEKAGIRWRNETEIHVDPDSGNVSAAVVQPSGRATFIARARYRPEGDHYEIFNKNGDSDGTADTLEEAKAQLQERADEWARTTEPVTGEDLYRGLMEREPMGSEQSAGRAVSRRLREAGITGTRFFDRESRYRTGETDVTLPSGNHIVTPVERKEALYRAGELYAKTGGDYGRAIELAESGATRSILGRWRDLGATVKFTPAEGTRNYVVFRGDEADIESVEAPRRRLVGEGDEPRGVVPLPGQRGFFGNDIPKEGEAPPTKPAELFETPRERVERTSAPATGKRMILRDPQGREIARLRLLRDEGRGMGTYEIESWGPGGTENIPHYTPPITLREFFRQRADRKLMDRDGNVIRQGAPNGYLQTTVADAKYLHEAPEREAPTETQSRLFQEPGEQGGLFGVESPRRTYEGQRDLFGEERPAPADRGAQAAAPGEPPLHGRPDRGEAGRGERAAAREARRFVAQLAVEGRNEARRRGEVSGLRTLATRLAAEFRRRGKINFKGQIVLTPHDAATISQVSRSPRVETTRFFFLDEKGETLDNADYTSDMPGSVVFGVVGEKSERAGFKKRDALLQLPEERLMELERQYGSIDNVPLDAIPELRGKGRRPAIVYEEIRERMKRLGATSYVIQHNHPSGDPMPSHADVEHSRLLRENVPGFKFHVIIDTGKYSVIDDAYLDSDRFHLDKSEIGAKRADIFDIEPIDYRSAHELNYNVPLLERANKIEGPEDAPITAQNIARAGKEIVTGKGYTTLLYTNANGRLETIQHAPHGLMKNPEEAANVIRGRAREFGANMVFAYEPTLGKNRELDLALRELVRTNAIGNAVGPGETGLLRPGIREPGYKYGRFTRTSIRLTGEEERPLEGERPAGAYRSPDEMLRALSGAERPQRFEERRSAQEAHRTERIVRQLAKREEAKGPVPKYQGENVAQQIARDVHRGLSPGTYGPAARIGGSSMRQHLAESALARVRARALAESSIKELDKLSTDDRNAWINRVETNQKQPTEALQHAHDLARALADEGRTELQKLGRLQNGFYQYYFPHLWKRPGQVETRLAEFYGKRPFEGPKSFLKKRKYPTYAEGLEAGLEPKFDNPMEALLAHRAMVDRYVAAMKTVKDGLAEGWIKRVFVDGRPPAGWRPLPESFGTIYGDRKIPVQEQIDERQWKQLHDFASSIGIKHERRGPGRFPRGTFGYTEWPGNEVHTQFATGMGTLTHEIGHQLDFRFGLWDAMHPKGAMRQTKGGRLVEDPKAIERRTKIEKELRDLADLRGEPLEGPVPEGSDYQRKRTEKMANLVDAYVNHRDRMREVAPTALSALEEKIAQHPELAPLRKIRPSLVRGIREDTIDAGGKVIAGQLYAPAEVVRLFDNHLTPGLHGKPLYDAMRAAGNSMNQFQLGFSAFHAGFTTMDAMVSKTALGLEQLSRGQTLRGAANVALGFSPTTAITNVLRGNKVLREALGGELTDDVKMVLEAGGRFRQDTFYDSGAIRGFQKAWREGKYGSAAMRAPLALAELVSRPVLEELVPRQKLGVFLDLAKAEVERLGPDATVQERRYALARAWDSVDNRMGQVVYDNQFWNKTAKDLAMLSVRSLGWNIGTLRELGGAGFDVATLGKRLGEGRGPRDAAFTHRMAYAMALPMVAGFYGALYQKLMTGKDPESTKDYFFPQTGKVNPDGSLERVALPSYMKDIAAYREQPVTTIGHKLHPLLTTMAEMLENKDFYGTEIRDPEDSIPEQAKQLASHAAKSFLPFSVQGYKRMAESGEPTGKRLQSFVGITPASSYITKSEAQKEMSRAARESAPQAPRSHEQAEKKQALRGMEQAIRRGDLASAKEIGRKALDEGKITDYDLKRTEDRLGMTLNQVHFKPLPVEAKLRVWKVATPAERDELRPLLARTLILADRANGAFSHKTQEELEDLGRKLRESVQADPALREAIQQASAQ